MPSPDNPTGKCAYLMNVYVRPKYRGQGYGRQIASWLVDQARQRGITKIYLESSECARMMYRKMGFKEMKDYYKL
jgi:GNAT superfamily N-acetyltransferase